MLTYFELIRSFKKGIRNGNWRRLERVEKAFYRASLCFSRVKGKIVNSKLVEHLSNILEKLLETPGMRIMRRGVERALEMIEKYEEAGVFKWAPQLKNWLKDPDYIFWLGTFSQWG